MIEVLQMLAFLFLPLLTLPLSIYETYKIIQEHYKFKEFMKYMKETGYDPKMIKKMEKEERKKARARHKALQ